jgi:dTDP-4-dehydrorhamnose reductase
VDKAEEEKELAFKINAEAPKLLGQLCFKNKIQLIHFSTDYVFDGKSETPYVEEDNIFPINTYGESKAMGEKYVSQENPQALIIRTSWVYSSHGHNFVKTMIKYGKEREELKVVDDQFGAPTWAHELAKVTLQAIDKNLSGVYHFSNEGKCSWYEFALEIKKLSNFKAIITPIPSKDYQTKAVRPKFSLLCKDKIKRDLKIEIPDWKDSLKSMIREVL